MVSWLVYRMMCALSFFPGEWVLLCKKNFDIWWLKPMTNSYYLIVSVDQEPRDSSARRFWLRVSHETVVKLLVRDAVI